MFLRQVWLFVLSPCDYFCSLHHKATRPQQVILHSSSFVEPLGESNGPYLFLMLIPCVFFIWVFWIYPSLFLTIYLIPQHTSQRHLDMLNNSYFGTRNVYTGWWLTVGKVGLLMGKKKIVLFGSNRIRKIAMVFRVAKVPALVFHCQDVESEGWACLLEGCLFTLWRTHDIWQSAWVQYWTY